MSNARRRDLFDADKASGSDPSDHPAIAENFEDSSSVDSVSLNGVESAGASCRLPGESGGSRRETMLTQRLTDILVDQGDGDLLLQQTNQDDHLLQWFQALNMQIMGACRADERLKPLLKMNVSGGVAEDPLLTQLSQHFEPAEVGMLARCFCVPLVSIRVGTIHKEGSRLCPTANRGNLGLTLLPSSDLRLSFIGDDGNVERMFTLTKKSHCAAVVIEEIPEDSSGRSFLIRGPDGVTFYFWCSEKSKLLGTELLGKLKDLLKTKPSVADLSGISKSRLDCFATQLRAFLMGSSMGSIHESVACTSTPSANAMAHNASLSASKYARSRHSGSQAMKGNALYLGSLSPKSSSFKEGTPRNFSSFRIVREKLKRRCDSQQLALDDLSNDSLNTSDTTSSHIGHDKLPEVTKAFPPLSFLGSLGNLTVPSNLGQQVEVPPLATPLFAPHYCWCPPGVSTHPSPAAPSKFPVSSIESHPLPLDASLFPNAIPGSLLAPTPPLSLSTPMEFPPFLPDPLIRMPLPASQQIPTFTPLICDPIVHVPVIDVCSSGGQGYLVSAGPAMSTAIPPLHPNLVKPLISESDSVVKGARETLRLLMGRSSQTNKQVMDTLPAVLTNADEKPSIIVTGSRGLYAGTRDVDVIANSIAAMGLASLSGASRAESDSQDCGACGIPHEQVRDSSDATGS
ncbi:uncharacterized protein LOC129302990 [Prosopis cineraria]|uniref:uncharacterized protein LOC129302990 n=1 Tax=Prosopis cineraria TaxID=364024 RepID=UPI00240FD83C|nr:uncharacterized protein LOC129302990 [Prosopis cineraria]